MSKPRTVRAAAAQIAPDLNSREATLARVLDAIGEAAEQRRGTRRVPGDLRALVPVFFLRHSAGATGAEHIRLYEHAVVVPGRQTDAVAAAARKHGVVVVLGVNERDHGSLYNAQLIFDADGALMLKRRKITPDLPRADDLGTRRRLGPEGR